MYQQPLLDTLPLTRETNKQQQQKKKVEKQKNVSVTKEARNNARFAVFASCRSVVLLLCRGPVSRRQNKTGVKRVFAQEGSEQGNNNNKVGFHSKNWHRQHKK